MILTIYDGSPPKLFFGLSQKTHLGVTIGTQTRKGEMWKLLRTQFSL